MSEFKEIVRSKELFWDPRNKLPFSDFLYATFYVDGRIFAQADDSEAWLKLWISKKEADYLKSHGIKFWSF